MTSTVFCTFDGKYRRRGSFDGEFGEFCFKGLMLPIYKFAGR